MELNAKIFLETDGSYMLLVEEGKGTEAYIEVTEAELKQMAVAYAEASKKKKERGEKAVEEVKRIGKKAKVKAFLQKMILKKKIKSQLEKEKAKLAKPSVAKMVSLIEDSGHNPSIYSDDHADDEDPHPSDYNSLVKQLKEGKKTARQQSAWFTVYGGNGSGRLASGLLLKELALATDAPFKMNYSRELLDFEGVKLRKWLKTNFDNEIDEDFEPSQMGNTLVVIKVKDDAERKAALEWFEDYETALEKIIFR